MPQASTPTPSCWQAGCMRHELDGCHLTQHLGRRVQQAGRQWPADGCALLSRAVRDNRAATPTAAQSPGCWVASPHYPCTHSCLRTRATVSVFMHQGSFLLPVWCQLPLCPTVHASCLPLCRCTAHAGWWASGRSMTRILPPSICTPKTYVCRPASGPALASWAPSPSGI